MAAQFRDITDIELRCAIALRPGHVTYIPGCWDKRFARELWGQATLRRKITDKQADAMWRLAWKYRRQLTKQTQVLQRAKEIHNGRPKNERDGGEETAGRAAGDES